jgi:hypothetical protein
MYLYEAIQNKRFETLLYCAYNIDIIIVHITRRLLSLTAYFRVGRKAPRGKVLRLMQELPEKWSNFVSEQEDR